MKVWCTCLGASRSYETHYKTGRRLVAQDIGERDSQEGSGFFQIKKKWIARWPVLPWNKQWVLCAITSPPPPKVMIWLRALWRRWKGTIPSWATSLIQRMWWRNCKESSMTTILINCNVHWAICLQCCSRKKIDNLNIPTILDYGVNTKDQVNWNWCFYDRKNQASSEKNYLNNEVN